MERGEGEMKEEARKKIAKFIYEHHYSRMFRTWEELKEKYHGSAESNMQEADAILALEGEDWRIAVVEKVSELPRQTSENEYLGKVFIAKESDLAGWVKEVIRDNE